MSFKLDRLISDALTPLSGAPRIDFTAPAGAPALFAPDSLTWRIMKNPVALMIGGIAAVLLELAEPRVRTGVWEFTRFRDDPVGRMKRTGYAALVTAYAPAEAARAMIAGVNRMHARIEGETRAGVKFRANEPELLNWVQATAAFGFAEATHRFVRPLSSQERDQLLSEGAGVAALYGANDAPRSQAEWEALLEATRPKLEPSPILTDFTAIIRAAPLLPAPLKPLQGLILCGAVSLLPDWARTQLGFDKGFDLPTGGRSLLRRLGGFADTLVLKTAPPAHACVRMGLPASWLYRRDRAWQL